MHLTIQSLVCNSIGSSIASFPGHSLNKWSKNEANYIPKGLALSTRLGTVLRMFMHVFQAYAQKKFLLHTYMSNRNTSMMAN